MGSAAQDVKFFSKVRGWQLLNENGVSRLLTVETDCFFLQIVRDFSAFSSEICSLEDTLNGY